MKIPEKSFRAFVLKWIGCANKNTKALVSVDGVGTSLANVQYRGRPKANERSTSHRDQKKFLLSHPHSRRNRSTTIRDIRKRSPYCSRTSARFFYLVGHVPHLRPNEKAPGGGRKGEEGVYV